MRGLPLLIRLARQDSDERRADLLRIAGAHTAATTMLAAHDRRAAGEALLAGTTPEAHAAYTAWLPADLRRRAGLHLQAAQLARTEAAAHEALRDSVTGLKRLETAQTTAADTERRTAQRRAALQADERETLRAAWRNQKAPA